MHGCIKNKPLLNDPKHASLDNLLDQGVPEIMNLKLFEILSLKQPGLDPSNTKIHLNVENWEEDPLDNYLKDEGKGEEWRQTWQKMKHFERAHIVVLMRLSGEDRWLFKGCYESHGCGEKIDDHHRYSVKVISSMTELTQRIIVSFKSSSRNYYRDAESCSDEIFVHELLPEKMSVGGVSGT